MEGREELIQQLREITCKSTQAIIEVLDIVDTEIPDEPLDVRFEQVVNLLLSNGCEANPCINGLSDQEVSDMYFTLIDVFPDCNPTYLREFCQNNARSLNFQSMADHLSTEGYPKRDEYQDTCSYLQSVLPDADPSYLADQARAFLGKPRHLLDEFINGAIDKQEYPTKQEYLKREKEIQEISQYTTNFKVENFVLRIPTPLEYFNDPSRQQSLADKNNTDEAQLKADRDYAFSFLVNHYRYHRIKDIRRLWEHYNYNLVRVATRLDTLKKAFRTPRNIEFCDLTCKNINLLQEIAFVVHRQEIIAYVKWNNENYRRAKEVARQRGLLQTCECCCECELIPEEVYCCPKRCIFCKECVKRGAEIVIGNYGLSFPCLADCGSEFSYSILQMVLDPVVFARLVLRKQMDDVKKAEIDGLENCPFCEFSTVPAAEDKIFKCQNPDCMRETCRECKHEAHIPLKCSEIEYDEDVKMRTYIENKMTERRIRSCWKCKKEFIKETGCNKMTCTCGAYMCYICRSPVQGYDHFGSGRCPLYSEDLEELDRNAVLHAANEAKAELGVTADPGKLKFDPTKNFNQQFQ